MKKVLSILSKVLCLLGIVFLILGGWIYIENKILEKKALQEAEGIIRQEQKAGDSFQAKQSFQPQVLETIGILEIPRINSVLPIVEGAHEDSLKKGVGHYTGTGYPLDNEQIFLSGHRDTVFRRLGELEIGDILRIIMPYGRFHYKIVDTKIVNPDDKSIIVPHDEEILTLSTCYPFRYSGNAPQRYIIYAKPVQ